MIQPTVNQDGKIELNGFDPTPSAVSEADTSSLHNRIKRSFFRSTFIPEKSVEAYLTRKDNSHLITQNIVSGGPQAKSGSSSALRNIKPGPNLVITPTPPASLNGAASVARRHRSCVGGKGQFLTVMTKAGLPVPNFNVIPYTMLQIIDSVMIEPQVLAQFHPGGIDASQLQPVTLGSLKDSIPTMDRINQANWLNALGKLLISDDFLQKVGMLPVTDEIRRMYQELVLVNPSQPVIIRSSGLKEDGFGDAQAGKYESCLHSGGDILKSCLEVLASSYQPALCPDGKPHPVALIMQTYLNCRFGGVVLSHTSLRNDALQIEYTPGQPRSAVAGTYSFKPHCYQIKRNGDTSIRWGDVPSYFTLKETAEGFIEEKHEGPSAEKLPEGIPEQLKRHIVQLENLLGCPVDVEFAVDQQDRLFLVQVRPVTSLLGAASFSGAPPDQPLYAGEVVSEGLATGEVYYADKPVADSSSIPKGAIIHAINADPWMLEPAIINRAGGYVFKNGGNNDHIAIMLKQSGKPCMRSDAPFTAEQAKSLSKVTLLAGNFDQTCVAYLLDGDQTVHWRTRYTKPTLDYATAACAANKPCAPTFRRVEQGFLWLHAQNQQVLNYFQRGRLLDLCLAPGHNKLLSMSPQRTEVLQAMKVEVDNFLQDLQYLVEGYERFLNLHSLGEVSKEQDIEKVRPFLEDIQPLNERLTTIKSQVQNLANKITEPMITHQELPEQPIDYQQWLNDGETLINELQQLNQPSVVDDIRSAHDLVFYIHKQFIAALEPVASLSGQGVVEKMGTSTISSFLSDKSESLFTESMKEAINSAGKFVVLNLPTACIANIKLGVHVCTVAMFEHGEGGKGRKLRLVISDDFVKSDHQQGKLKRFWYLAHAIQSKLAGKGVRNMTTHLNPATGALTFERRHIESTEAMKESFLSLTKFLPTIRNIDIPITHINISGRPEMWRWDYTTVEKMIRESQDDLQKNDFTFKLCLSYQGLDVLSQLNTRHIQSQYSMEHQIFFNAGESFHDNIKDKKWRSDQHLLDGIDQWLTKITAPLQPDAERVKKELAFIMLISHHRDSHKTLHNFVKQKYPEEFADNDFLKKLSCHSVTFFSNLPVKLRNSKSFASDVIMSHERAFQHAGIDIKSDKSTVITMLQRYPHNLFYVESALKEDSDVVLAAVKQMGFTLDYAGVSPRNNYEVVMTAISNDPAAINSAGDNFKKSDKFMLDAVRKNPMVLLFIQPISRNLAISQAALKENRNMKKYIVTSSINNPEFLPLTANDLPKDKKDKGHPQIKH